MYLSYFGLSDNPFSIAPNPDYLYMSPRHKEALAHLIFGLRESGGFVMLTGEVGTGKTTVSRKLMQQLPDNTQVAMILNPTLSALELLGTICNELGIEYKRKHASLKYFTDQILEKLANNHDHGVNTVLIVDEAQHLLPEVLEQLHFVLNSSASKNLTEEFLVKKINSFFKNIAYNNLFLLKEKIPISNKPLNIITSNNLTSLNATIEPL